jgi:hypothetical protein
MNGAEGGVIRACAASFAANSPRYGIKVANAEVGSTQHFHDAGQSRTLLEFG